MKTVHLARGLTLPAVELATEVVASLGQRGSGKSNGAGVVAEGLLAAGIQVIVLDHVGIWFSLRLDESGKRSSPYQIPVLGGQHGDIGLAATTGTVVAEALARSGSSAVLDVSAFSKGDRCRFAADFAEAFFAAKKLHPGPVQILLEEAQRYVPQKLFAGQGLERMLGAFEEIAEVGRNYGVGLHLISQRPQKINKDVLNLADTVLAYRANGVLERKAISEWVQEKGAEGRKEMHDELPGLARGTAIVWSPNRAIYNRFAITKKSTYDAGATPTHARAAVKTKRLDLDKLEEAMGAAMKQAEANDPRALKMRIAELERAAKLVPAPIVQSGKTKTVEVPVFKESDLKRIEKLASKLGKREDAFKELFVAAVDRLAQAQQAIVSEIGSLQMVLGRTKEPNAPCAIVSTNGITRTTTQPQRFESRPRQVRAVDRGESGPTDLSRCARALLRVLAVRGNASDSQISALSGYKKTSSSFANGLSELRTRGFIDGSPDNRVITAQGKETAGPQEPLPTGPALVPYWVSRLTKSEATMLQVIYRFGTISREDLAREAEYSITSSSFANALSGLRTLDLIRGRPGGDVTIADVFQE